MKITKKIQYQSNLHKYFIQLEDNKKPVSLFITSDVHIDNPKTKQENFLKDLEKAKTDNALVIINGDLLCLMQGKYDPRKSKGDIRPEHNGSSYIDLVIDDISDKLVPFANNIIQINEGNHETAISSRLETNILQRLVERINTKAGTNIQLGAYVGMIILEIKGKKNTSKLSYKIAYSHGHWGGGVSKGTSATMKYGQMFPDADLVCSGHTHDQWHMVISRYKYNSNRQKLEIKNQDHIKTGTYKEEFEKGSGWAVEKLALPKVRGSYWVDLFFNRTKEGYFLTRQIKSTLSEI